MSEQIKAHSVLASQNKKSGGDKGQVNPGSGKPKNAINTIEVRSYKEKSDLKLFKRQSYHVAIAYHIHLRVKGMAQSSSDQEELDPTIHARRLR